MREIRTSFCEKGDIFNERNNILIEQRSHNYKSNIAEEYDRSLEDIEIKKITNRHMSKLIQSGDLKNLKFFLAKQHSPEFKRKDILSCLNSGHLHVIYYLTHKYGVNLNDALKNANSIFEYALNAEVCNQSSLSKQCLSCIEQYKNQERPKNSQNIRDTFMH
jgi:hypothetical protein